MSFISERFIQSRATDGGLPIMFTIRGETDIPEFELTHLDGYKGSRPVRIGNGAAFHQQFDIYVRHLSIGHGQGRDADRSRVN